jgi:molybdate transport system regulatory protein
MNRCFREPLVDAHPGSGSKAGARLTEAGKNALDAYERLVAAATGGAGGEPLHKLQSALRDTPRGPK